VKAVPDDWVRELRRQWATLTSAPDDGSVAARVVSASADGRPIRLAVDGTGKRELLVPMVELDEARPSSVESAVALSARTLVFKGASAEFLVLTCSRTDLFDLFDEFLAAVLGEIVESATPVNLVVEALSRWRDLLRTRAAAGLEVSEEMGLVGELVIFEMLLSSRPSLSVEVWRGPFNEPRDFELEDVTVEVKAHGTAQASVIIHGLEQLDCVVGKSGLLAVVELAQGESGRAVSDLVVSLESRGLDSTVLRARLLEVGWHGPASPERRWVVVSVTVANVTSLPRIIPAGVGGWPIEGVVKVQYELALAEIWKVSAPGATALAEAIEVRDE